MDREQLLQSLDQLLEVPAGTLKGPEQLSDIETWDSLSMMNFIALANQQAGATLSPRQLANCNTVDDLLKLASPTAA